MVGGGEDKEILLDLFTKHSRHLQNITVLYLCQDMFPLEKYAKSISRNAHYIVAFKNQQDQLGMRNLLLQAFPTCWQDMMGVYQKLAERPFGYTVLDLQPGSHDRKRVFSHLLHIWRTKVTRAGIWEREKMSDHWTKWYIKNHFNRLDSFEARCLGWRPTREKRPWMIVQQIFLGPWKKTVMTA